MKPLLILNDNKRPWGFLMLTALAVGMPVFMGAWLNQFSSAVLASMGGLVILHMQQTHITRRMMIMIVCSFGFSMSFSLGTLTSFNPYLSAATLVITIFLVTLTCRLYTIPPPGSFFFILVACVSRTLPFDVTLVAERTGILLLGCMGACLLALIYSITQIIFKQHKPVRPNDEVVERRIAAIMLESAVISLFVGGGYFLALMMQLENPYWVPISTAAIMQGATFRAVWQRNVHRIVGTVIGMGLAWGIFSLSPSIWTLASLVMLLTFIVEVLITRNYGLAVIFITPLTVILADSAMAFADPEHLILTRLVDIMIGSCIGYLGGWVMHHPRFFYRLEQKVINR